MANKHGQLEKGFTLIEVVIYVGIVMGMLGSSFLIVNNILNAQERSTIESEVYDNAHFVMRKIGWAMRSAESINTPVANASSTMLSITKASSTENPIVFDLVSSIVRLSTGGGDAIPLTTDHVQISSLIFTHVDPEQGPSSVRVELEVQSVAQPRLANYSASTSLSTTFFLD